MNKKSCTCKACGAEIRTGAKFCQYCGAKIEKPIYKKWWFWLIVVAVIGSIGKSGDDTSAESTHEVPTEVATVTTENTTVKETISATDAVSAWKEKINSFMVDEFDYYDIIADESGATISIATNGFAEVMETAKAYGYDENYESWSNVRTSIIDMCNVFSDYAVTFGLDNYPITVAVLDDRNHDIVMLNIKSGEISYDYMAEATTAATQATTEAAIETTEATENNDEFTTDYVLNTNSRKFHYPSCSSAKQTKDSNKAYFTGTRDEVIKKGYSPCGRCCP